MGCSTAMDTRRVSLSLFLLTAALVGGYFGIEAYFRVFDVTEEEVLRQSSPNGEVVVHTFDAGATTRTAYHVAVVEPGDGFDEDAVVLVADTISDVHDFNFRWVGEDLTISLPSSARIFHRSKRDLTGRHCIAFRSFDQNGPP